VVSILIFHRFMIKECVIIIITQHWVRKNTRKYQTSSATLKLIEMVWYQLSATYLVKHPQIIQPVALLKFRVEAIPMFLLTVPIQICQVKLVLCFTGGPPCQHTELVNVHTHDNWAFECLTALVNTFLWISSVCWNKRLIFLFSLLCLFCLKNARIVYVYMLPSHVCNMCTFMSVVHTSWRMRYKLMCFHIYEKHIKYIYFRF
jgi:hypothetical protein